MTAACWYSAAAAWAALLALALAPALSAARGASARGHERQPDVGFDLLFASQPEEVVAPVPAPASSGEVPAWLNGSVIRNGPGQFSYGVRNVTHAFDGSAKLQRWAFSGGRVTFQTAFVRSSVREESVRTDKFAPQLLFDRLDPCFTVFGKLASLFSPSDNYNVNVFPVGDGRAIVTSDVTKSIVFDTATLRTVGHTNYSDSLVAKDIVLGSAHPLEYEAGGSRYVVNQAVRMNLVGPNNSTVMVFRVGTGAGSFGAPRREVFGTVALPITPYIHSFAITEQYLVLVAWPVSFETLKLLELNPLVDIFTWFSGANATVHVFDLHSTDPGAAPVRSFAVPAFFAFHHINAFEDAAGNVVFDLAAYDDTMCFQGPFAFGVVDVLTNPETRYRGPTPYVRRYTLDMSAGGAASFAVAHLVDAAGNEWHIDMPRINEERRGKKYCYAYGLHLSLPRWSIVKADMCAAPSGSGPAPSAVVWTQQNHYPTEPIFVPRPGATAEDDGVVLSNVLDGEARVTYMLVLNATTMETLATVPAPGNRVVPWNLHGQPFF